MSGRLNGREVAIVYWGDARSGDARSGGATEVVGPDFYAASREAAEFAAAKRAGTLRGKTVAMAKATWCGACTHALPHFMALMQKAPGVAYTVVDYDAHKDAVAALPRLTAFPTFVTFEDGEVRGSFVGYDEAALRKFVAASTPPTPPRRSPPTSVAELVVFIFQNFFYCTSFENV